MGKDKMMVLQFDLSSFSIKKIMEGSPLCQVLLLFPELWEHAVPENVYANVLKHFPLCFTLEASKLGVLPNEQVSMWTKINRVNRKPSESEKNFAKHAYDREVIFRIFKELRKVAIK